MLLKTLEKPYSSQIFSNIYLHLAQVNWNGNNWALNCIFNGNDMSSVRVSGEECGGRCASTQGCTHWSWTSGTCFLKRGVICSNQAVARQGTNCGYIQQTCSGTDGSTDMISNLTETIVLKF